MRMTGVAISALLALCGAAASALAQQSGPPGSYDYYLLAYSWTPAYCTREGAKADPNQCAPGVNAGFVLHGLWPQRDAGGWPENCKTDARVPRPIVDAMLEVMPSAGLVEHQWTKHGSCTGLTPDDYFAETRAAWERVRIPPEFTASGPGQSVPAEEVERRFLELNDLFQLRADGVAMICDRKGVYEIRICMDKDLNFRPCGKGVEDTCRRGESLVGR